MKNTKGEKMKNTKGEKKKDIGAFFLGLVGEFLGELLAMLLMLAIGGGLFLLGRWLLPDVFENSPAPESLIAVGGLGFLIFMAILGGIFKMFQKKGASLEEKNEVADETNQSQTETQPDMTYENRIDL